LLPALRLGYIVGNGETAPALAASKSVSCLGLPTMVEAAVFEFLDRGYYDAHLKQLQHELDRRYQNCLNILRQTMPDSVKWTTPGGGPCVWLEVPQNVCLKTLQDRLAKRNVMIYPSFDSFFDKPHLNGFRIGYAWLPPEKMQQGLEILAETLHKDW
ncbi:MAG: aminotransferase class I/II-fold pyridoxal phosphate-dependent enzyme, partial [bacterium]|nr:aminotransferase class I/II-fold pyridoxal phosphate-dependent enzyme [bacterium]